ncbi:hypothetical protein Pmar_PMAR014482 [Perkinsus marinus ATCC 50983]|uniref:Bowman-Birk serine protease inhibitors family domain-containing protein n=1 Tax=Perkinsus marinus (strain ATCC 50983 / TXsc) TaxID=423536 RepID=C5KM21_PERM5|nr:hypothetical protein Pmar_PMAR014482 [Perkinsus marinus ATCC 50983]EER14474.1 hypothetical protein Pmar_PMAR014482 [Perkinsus marinus ATCC 50983]|eukprot:XP_002782679.1 hypothetical protein Pmar_PMAR014482 [Perkinsus marinus ATCC 50983]
MKLPTIPTILLILSVVNGDAHLAGTGKINSDIMMDMQADNGGHVSEFDLEQNSPNNLEDEVQCAVCESCKVFPWLDICPAIQDICDDDCGRCC